MRQEPDDLTARPEHEEEGLFENAEARHIAPTGDVDPIELMWNDHDRIELLFDQYEGEYSDEAAMVLQCLLAELRLHLRLEEEVLYQELAEKGGAAVKGVLAESKGEHAQIKEILARLAPIEPGEPGFEQKVGELQAAFERHMEHEEEALYAAVRDVLVANDITDLGRRLEDCRRRWQVEG
jgi:hypothetical protein